MQYSKYCALAFGTLFLTVSPLVAHVASADTTDVNKCPGNTTPATAEDVAIMTAAGIPNAKVGMCWDRNSTSVGADEGTAKQYLSSILCSPDNDNYGGMGPVDTIQKLDGKFAVCAASFLKAANQTKKVCVREGARSVAKQNEYVSRGVIACKKGAGCEHPRGIAIDVNVVGAKDQCTSYQWLFQMAPQYGLIFYLGCKDAVHFVPAKGGCNAGGTTPVDGTIAASNYDFPSDYTNATQNSPLAVWQSIVGAMNRAFSSSGTTGSTGSTGSQTGVCTAQNICSGSTLYYQNTSCNLQVMQTCQYGCSGTVCAASSTTSTNLLTSLIGTLPTSTQSSLESLVTPAAGLVTSITDTAEPVSLNEDLSSQQSDQSLVSSQSGAQLTVITADNPLAINSTFPQSSSIPQTAEQTAADGQTALSQVKSIMTQFLQVTLTQLKLGLESLVKFLTRS